MQKLNIYCDGGARGNPGPAASAFAAFNGKVALHEESEYLGKTTNNVAEYSAVILAIKWLENNIKIYNDYEINFFLDSQLVVNQLSGKFKIKSKNLIPLAATVKNSKVYKDTIVKFNYIPRTKNKLADSLVNVKLDAVS